MNPSLTDSRRQALRSASHWYAVLSGERVSPQQEARWQQWYEQSRDHQWAWQQVENLRQQMGQLPGPLASRTLNDSRLTRRQVLKGVLLLAAGGSWQMWNSELAEGLRADYRTAKGLPLRQSRPVPAVPAPTAGHLRVTGPTGQRVRTSMPPWPWHR